MTIFYDPLEQFDAIDEPGRPNLERIAHHVLSAKRLAFTYCDGDSGKGPLLAEVYEFEGERIVVRYSRRQPFHAVDIKVGETPKEKKAKTAEVWRVSSLTGDLDVSCHRCKRAGLRVPVEELRTKHGPIRVVCNATM